MRSDKGMIVHTVRPFNAEPTTTRLRRALVTGRSDFYVRCHGDIPELDAASHRLRVGGLVGTPLDLTVAALRERFAARRVTAVMQCAGNRRADMQPVGATSGDPWGPGAIGNAVWGGVALADVLAAAGAETDGSLHVAFDCCDVVEIEGEARFGVSIPMDKALMPDVLLAFAMNGEALAPEHGHPLRVVVPGYAGVRSAKWLSAITVQDAPSDNHMQQRDYKLFPGGVTAETVDWDKGVTINAMPLNAAICEPVAFDVLQAGTATIRGYAVAGERAVAKVDVSADGGANWCQARLEHDEAAPWSWTFWSVVVEIGVGEHELVVRAWDSAGRTQPARVEEVWNFKGYLSAAWHRVRVSVV